MFVTLLQHASLLILMKIKETGSLTLTSKTSTAYLNVKIHCGPVSPCIVECQHYLVAGAPIKMIIQPSTLTLSLLTLFYYKLINNLAR